MVKKSVISKVVVAFVICLSLTVSAVAEESSSNVRDVQGAGAVDCTHVRDVQGGWAVDCTQGCFVPPLPPTFNLPSGPILSGTRITLTSSVRNGFIFYTTDGSDPIVYGIRYMNAIGISRAAGVEVKAVTYYEGNYSIVVTRYYTPVVAKELVVTTQALPTTKLVSGEQSLQRVSVAVDAYTTAKAVTSLKFKILSSNCYIDESSFKLYVQGINVTSSSYVISYDGVGGMSIILDLKDLVEIKPGSVKSFDLKGAVEGVVSDDYVSTKLVNLTVVEYHEVDVPTTTLQN